MPDSPLARGFRGSNGEGERGSNPRWTEPPIPVCETGANRPKRPVVTGVRERGGKPGGKREGHWLLAYVCTDPIVCAPGHPSGRFVITSAQRRGGCDRGEVSFGRDAADRHQKRCQVRARRIVPRTRCPTERSRNRRRQGGWKWRNRLASSAEQVRGAPTRKPCLPRKRGLGSSRRQVPRRTESRSSTKSPSASTRRSRRRRSTSGCSRVSSFPTFSSPRSAVRGFVAKQERRR